MAKGKQYPLVIALKNEYGIALTNTEFDRIISVHARRNYTSRKIYNLLLTYGKLAKVREWGSDLSKFNAVADPNSKTKIVTRAKIRVKKKNNNG